MTFKFIPPVKCIKCKKEILPYENEENKYEMVQKGIVDTISANYGSCHDGSVFQIGICDACIKTSPELVFLGDYINNQSAEEVNKSIEEANKRHEFLRPTFNSLKEEWLSDIRFLLSIGSIDAVVTDGKKIIKMNNDAIGFILEEMQKDFLEAPWYLLMKEIILNGPEIPIGLKRNISESNSIWIGWLREKGYLEALPPDSAEETHII